MTNIGARRIAQGLARLPAVKGLAGEGKAPPAEKEVVGLYQKYF
jgi:hypothetical protein